MEREHDFTRGPILPSLLRFALPVLLALLLQAMYGAVDLQVVGKFGAAADISAVSTGSQVVHTVTVVITGLAMGVTVLLGQKIVVMHPDSTICEFDLTDLPYPRDPDSPRLRQLKEQITAQCRMATAN